jgi:hypothetical protein
MQQGRVEPKAAMGKDTVASERPDSSRPSALFPRAPHNHNTATKGNQGASQ